MPFPLIPITFAVGKTLFDILGSHQQQDPTEVAQARLEQALNAMRGYFTQEEIGLKSDARTESAIAKLAGAREKAATGYTGSVSAFTAPAEGAIGNRLSRALQALKAQKARSVGDIRMAEASLPFYQKPSGYDYLGAGLGAAGNIYAANQAGENAVKVEEMKTNALRDTLSESFSTWMGKGGQTPIDGAMNRLMSPSFGEGKSFTPESQSLEMFYPGMKSRSSFNRFFPEGQ